MPSTYDSGVRPIIDAHLAKLSEERRDYGDYWPASSAGYCQRKVIFDRLQVPFVGEDARKQRVFSSGHIFHEWIQRITNDAGVSVVQELELQDEDLMVRGHVDDLVLIGEPTFEFGEYDPVGGQIVLPNPARRLILYDYKTAHSKWFEYAKGRPMSHYHRHQIGTYLLMVRLAQGKIEALKGLPLVTEGRRLSISKDDLRLAEKVLEFDAELETAIRHYWSSLNAAWQTFQKTGVLPPCTCAQIEVNSRTGKGFMADEKYNPYFYDGEPCSEVWYHQQKTEGNLPM
jgi:hypothetical protein